MKNDKLLGEELVNLQQERGNICVSMIVPTHRLASERRVDKYEVEKAITHVSQLLTYKYSEEEGKALLADLKEMAASIDYDHNMDGIGIFISEGVKTIIKFPFPVAEKVMVGDNFEIRDVLYKTKLSRPYYCLVLTEKKVRLFEGAMEQLTEIKGKHFPHDYFDDYIYNTPSRGSSNIGNPQMRSFEHDKSAMEAIRFKDFYRDVDAYLGDYLVQNMPLIVTGTDKDISWFESVTRFKQHIVGKVSGSYDDASITEIGKRCWTSFQKFVHEETEQLINTFTEKVGAGLGVTGIQDIWSVALEGRAWKLIVEKDFKVPGFTQQQNEQFMALRPPKGKHQTMSDAVDEIIEIVLEKGGDVFFTDSQRLSAYGGMVLITRY